MAQYIRAIQDTTVLPITQLWEGRFIRIAGKFYEYQRGGWYSGNVYTMYHKDSLGGAIKLTTPRNINGVAFDGTQDITITATANVDSTIWAKLWKLGLYSLIGHTHVKANITDFAHTHPESDVTNLTTDLAGKQATHDTLVAWRKMDSVRVNALRGADTVRTIAREGLKANSVHTHAESDVTNLTTDLANKAPLASPSLTTPNIGVATGTSLAVTGAITSSGAGIGYASGAGGTVTQLSSRTTGVTLSKLSGTITMFSSAVAAAASSTFTWTNTFITATDIVIMDHNSTTNPACWKCEVICGSGSATVVVKNISAASITEATPLKFIIIKTPNN